MKSERAGMFALRCAFIICVAASYPAAAGPFDNLLGGGTKSESQVATVSADELNQQLTALNARFTKSLVAMLSAQALTYRALGNKEDADDLQKEADALAGENTLNDVMRAMERSENASAELVEIERKKEIQDAEAKKHIVNAVPFYAVGMANTAKLPGEYQTWAKNAEATVSGMKSNPLSAMSAGGLAGDLADVLEVTSKLPGLISIWSTTTSNFIDLAKTNKVDTKGLANKI